MVVGREIRVILVATSMNVYISVPVFELRTPRTSEALCKDSENGYERAGKP